MIIPRLTMKTSKKRISLLMNKYADAKSYYEKALTYKPNEDYPEKIKLIKLFNY